MLNSVPAPKQAARPAKVLATKPFKTQLYKYARLAHVYLSTATLLVILFFSVTGFLLNHPDWSSAKEPVTQDLSGTLPDGWFKNGQIDWLRVAEYMRHEHNVHGQVGDYWSDETTGQLNFTGPGYTADVFIDLPTGDYSLYTESQGLLAFINDLHKGHGTGQGWNWTIDATAIFLILISLSGLVLTLLLKKLRNKGLVTMIIGGLLSFVILFLAL